MDPISRHVDDNRPALCPGSDNPLSDSDLRPLRMDGYPTDDRRGLGLRLPHDIWNRRGPQPLLDGQHLALGWKARDPSPISHEHCFFKHKHEQ